MRLTMGTWSSAIPLLGLLLGAVHCGNGDSNGGSGGRGGAGQSGAGQGGVGQGGVAKGGASGSGAQSGGVSGGAGTAGGASPTGGSKNSGGAPQSGGKHGGNAGAASGGGAGSDPGSDAGAGGYAGSDAGAGGQAGDGQAGAGGDSGEGVVPSTPVHGRVRVGIRENRDPAASNGYVDAAFHDQALRLDAFAAYPPDLHEVSLQGGDCTLFEAAARQCNPPCGASQYCGAGNLCKAAAKLAAAGAITVNGVGAALSLVPNSNGYTELEFPATNLTAASNVHVAAAGGLTPAFTLETRGVPVPSYVMSDDWEIRLVDGQDYVLTWTGASDAKVQLLLNSGWHGAPPEATLLCEAPGSAGRITIPAQIVAAYPPAGGAGLFQHWSWLSLMRRSSVVVGGKTIELIVSRDRLVQPIHD
jgi:hypothetical protein